LIRELKLEKPIVMGHSMGSSSATWFAARYPDVPRAVVLVDPGLTPRNYGASNADAQENRRLQLLEKNNMTFDELIALCNERNPDWSKAETDFWAVSKQLHHPNTSYRSRGTYPQKSELFPKITAPMLILKADAEGELRQKNEEVAGLLPDGRIAHIKDAGHSVHRDELESFLNELNAFLRAL